ncbi:MAG: hypothetical protein WAT23_15050 [Chromatiaceae bacterium]
MEAKLTSEQRALACDSIAQHLTEIASQENLKEAYYITKVNYLHGLGDAYLLDILRACDFTERDLQ